MNQSKYITVMLIPDGTESGRKFRIKAWVLKTSVISAAVLVVGILLFFIFYGSILSRAAMAERLKTENENLLRYQHKVKLLEENLLHTRSVVENLLAMAGIDYEFPELPTDSALFAQMDDNQTAILSRTGTGDLSIPMGRPVTGFISQDYHMEEGERYHPGVDFACAEGTPVLATANGEVVFADFDEYYGNMLVLKHNDSITTVYGHNKELLVEMGDSVMVGSRVALSGNTGNSTAPHLHYEIRINDQPIKPTEILR